MDRTKEFFEYINSIETPAELEGAFARAEKRQKRSRALRAVRRFSLTAAASVAAFALLVNVSVTTAYSIGKVPFLRELAKAVASSPSLVAAVENRYVQPIEQEVVQGGVTARVEYVIVDMHNLNVYYTLESDLYDELDATPFLSDGEGNKIDDISTSWGGMVEEQGDIRSIEVIFSEREVPPSLTLGLEVTGQSSEIDFDGLAPSQDTNESFLTDHEYVSPPVVAEVEFDLTFDPYFTAQGEIIEIGKEVEIEGNKILFESAAIYPTVMSVTFSQAEQNKDIVGDMEFYILNERGERFDGVAGGITASYDRENSHTKTYYLDSPFFSDSEEFTFFITGATLLDKEHERVYIDIENALAPYLPDGVRLEEVESFDSGTVLTFSVEYIEEGHMYQVFGSSYYGLDGHEHFMNSFASTNYFLDQNGEVDETRFTDFVSLKDYNETGVYLSSMFTHRVVLDREIDIKIK